MPYKEFGGKTIDDAVKKACNELNLTKDKMKYDVISYGSSGIFGLVRMKKARIRVFVKDDDFLSKELNIEDTITTTTTTNSSYRKTNYESDEQKHKKDNNDNFHSSPSRTKDYESNKRPYKNRTNYETNRRYHRDRSNYEDDRQNNNRSKNYESKSSYRDYDDNRVSKNVSEISYSEKNALFNKGLEVLQKIVDSITDNAKVSLEKNRDTILFKINGGNSAVLIGKHGQALDAMQFLLDKIINKDKIRNKLRILIDIEGYLKIREDSLTKLAKKLGDKVKKTGRPETVSPMNAHDRRIIHMALKYDPKLKTQSMGSGYYRKLVIFPQRKNW